MYASFLNLPVKAGINLPVKAGINLPATGRHSHALHLELFAVPPSSAIFGKLFEGIQKMR